MKTVKFRWVYRYGFWYLFREDDIQVINYYATAYFATWVVWKSNSVGVKITEKSGRKSSQNDCIEAATAEFIRQLRDGGIKKITINRISRFY